MKMKSIIFVALAILISVNFAKSDEIKFETESWEHILELAQKSNKYIYLDAYTDWCGWCKVMDKETFTDAKVIDFMKQNFIPARFEMETGFGKKLAMKYQVRAFPTSLVFAPDGTLIYKVAGYYPPAEFVSTLGAVLKKENHTNFKGISNNIDIDYPDFYQAVFAKRGSPEKRNPKKEQVIEYLSNCKDMFSEPAWAVLSTFESNDKFDKFFLDNIAKYQDLYGYKTANDKLYKLVYAKLQDDINNGNKDALNNVLAMIDKYDSKMAEENKEFYTNLYYEKTDNWAKVADVLQKKIDNGVLTPEMINERCWKIYEKCNDEAVVKKATQWMKNAVELSPNYAMMDTYAALLFKSKDYGNAEIIAKKAIELGKSDGENTKATEKLLEDIRANLK